MEVVASLSQGRTAAAQCGLFTYKSVPVIFEPSCISYYTEYYYIFHTKCFTIISEISVTVSIILITAELFAVVDNFTLDAQFIYLPEIQSPEAPTENSRMLH